LQTACPWACRSSVITLRKTGCWISPISINKSPIGTHIHLKVLS